MSVEQNPVAAMARSLAMSASIEVTPGSLADAAPLARLLGPGTAVYVPFLPRAHFRDIVSACRLLIEQGLHPVPHLAARAVRSQRQLEDWLGQLASAGVESLFLIAGDTYRPSGPFADTLRILDTGLLQRDGFKRLGIAGYPEGHLRIDTAVLRRALAFKIAYARETGTEMWLVTQFVFEAERKALRSQVGQPSAAVQAALIRP
jgi:methylenetetrahydrofolate reductase (NADPH)